MKFETKIDVLECAVFHIMSRSSYAFIKLLNLVRNEFIRM